MTSGATLCPILTPRATPTLDYPVHGRHAGHVHKVRDPVKGCMQPTVRVTATSDLQAELQDSKWQPTQPRRSPRRCMLYDCHRQLVPYHEAWHWQKDQIAAMTSPQVTPQQPAISTLLDPASSEHDRVIILQHPPVYTLGAGSTEANLLFSQDKQTECQTHIPVVRTERGGEVTYHGPGQLVAYPLLDLTHHRQDLHWYMRALEEVVIRALWEVSGLRGERIPGLTGVWVNGAKVAAIGVRAKRWVTYHGLALNVCPDLSPFQDIVPCGIKGRDVTSVHALLHGAGSSGAGVKVADAGEEAWLPNEEGKQLLDEYSFALLDAISQVFQLEMEQAWDAGPVKVL